MQNSAKAKAVTSPQFAIKHVMTGTAILMAATIWAGEGFAESHETIIETHGFSTFGDLKYPADFPYHDYVNPDAPKGGEISIAAQGTFDSMNPYATGKGTPGAMSTVAYERILASTMDEVSGAYCNLCTTLEYPESKDWVIFNLHRDITFSDGTPMTANDLVFSYNLLLEQGTPSYATSVKELIAKVEALDDYTIKYTFVESAPRNGLIEQAGSTPAWSQKWYEETGARLDESRLEISPGTGAYMLDSIDVGRRIIYKRNPDFWGADLPINVGHNNFDTIRIEYFADSQAAFEAFKAGEYTFRAENSSLSWATGYDFPALEKGWVVKEEIADGSLPYAGGFVFNLRREKLQDVRVRRALGMMFNFTWTNDTLQYGLFQHRQSFWNGSDLEAKGVAEGRELALLQSVADMIDPAILTDVAAPAYESGARQLDRTNLRNALALMEEAGFTTGDNGLLRDANGETLKIEFLETRQSFDRVITPYIDNLKKLGVDITYNRVDPSQYQARTQSNDFDMIFGGYTNALEEGQGIGQRYGSANKEDVFNPAGYSNPAVDKLIKVVEDADTREEMEAAVRAIDRIMRADFFVVPVWFLGKYWTAYYDMYEHPDVLPPYGLGYLDHWWYNAEKGEALRTAGALR